MWTRVVAKFSFRVALYTCTYVKVHAVSMWRLFRNCICAKLDDPLECVYVCALADAVLGARSRFIDALLRGLMLFGFASGRLPSTAAVFPKPWVHAARFGDPSELSLPLPAAAAGKLKEDLAWKK